jgi:hypothetical protein
MNYESAVKQCRQIIDSEACTSECERGQPKDSEVKCKKLCAQTIETPWYCQGAKPRQDGFHRYNFPVLNKIFDFAKKNETNKKVMGLQPNYTQGTIAVNTSHKQESNPTEKEPASIIKTTDAASWTVTTHRIIIDRPYDDFSGETKETPVKSTVSQKTDTTWETKWGK